MTTHVLILAAGKQASKSEYPGYLSEMDGVCLLERLAAKARAIGGARPTFAFLAEHVRKYRLDSVVQQISPTARLIKVPDGTRGAVCTAMLAAADMPDQDELLLVSANELVDVSWSGVVSEFRARSYDAGALIFQSIHPRYSFVKLDENGLVAQAAQFDPISRHATTGMFWFRQVADFMLAAKSAIRKELHTNGNYYVAPLFNELILRGRTVGALAIDAKLYMPLKSERHLAVFETSHLEASQAQLVHAL